jgi:cellulose synthase/poly-beta-1,6-N-acetylglucosamine synthase-like glycosyltransferase
MVLLIVYGLLGPLAWLFLALAMSAAYARMNRLIRHPCPALPDSPPAVTILIPAKDEGDGVAGCLERVMGLTYPRFDVIASDDRSTDQTGAVLDRFQSRFPDRFRALHIKEGQLPPGWLGKCNALHTAARQANGEWLLFVDSDVKVEPESLSLALSQAIARQYDAVSIMTRLECHSFLEKLILPLCAASVGVMTLMSLTNDDNRKRFAFANGQFFLIRRSVYEAVGGHASVRDNITEDVALMRLMKARGDATRLFYGQHMASTRMHTTLRQMLNGWARIYSGVSQRRAGRIIASAAFVALSGLSVYAALVYGIMQAGLGQWAWLVLSISHLAIMSIVLGVIYRMSGNPMRYALGFALAAPVMLGIYGYAIRACWTGRINWRGTTYNEGSADAHPGMVEPADVDASSAESKV